jgi:hypothetical protein
LLGLHLLLLTASQGTFQVVIGGFLQHLSVLEALDQLKFFPLHPLNHMLMLNPLRLLFDHLVLDLLLRPQLLLHQLPLLLLLRLLLLRTDHLLQRVILEGLLMTHNMHEIFLLLLLLFDGVGLTTDLIFYLAALDLKCSSLLLFDLEVDLFAECFFLLLLSLQSLSLVLLLHVSLSGNQYISGPLLGLIELLPCLFIAVLW